MSNLSMMNPGTSLNFDGAALQNQEEAEYRKEEEQQERELRQLLSNGFDDLLDDDILSVTSDDSVNVSGSLDPSESGRTPRRKRASGISRALRAGNTEWSHHGYEAPPANSRPQIPSHDQRFSQDEYNQPEHDEPNFGGTYNVAAKPTQEYHVDQFAGNYNQPATNLKNQVYLQWGGSVENLDLQRGQFEVTEHVQSQEEPVPEIQYAVSHFDELTPHTDPMNNRVIVGTERGKTEGGNDNFQKEHGHQYWSQNYAQHYRDLYRQDEIPGAGNSDNLQAGQNTFANTHRNLGSEIHISFPNGQTLPGNVYGMNSDQGPFSLNAETHQSEVPFEDSCPNSLPPGGIVRHTHRPQMDNPLPGPSSPRKQDFPEAYRVQYMGTHLDNQVNSINQRAHKMEQTNQETVDSQAEFLQQVSESGEEGRQLAQLQILYKARGRQLEELSSELETTKQETAREKRLLKHQLSIAQGEKEGAVSSYKQCQNILQETKDDNAQLLGKLQAVEAQAENLNSTREELLKKLQTAESTIENMSHELSSLQQSDSLSRARGQHEAVVSSMQQKFDQEILTLKQKLDSATEELSNKNSDILSLRQQVHDITRASEHSQISRAETINRLTHSLEESQKRCQSLLESASSQEVGELKINLKQAQASKKMSEEMCDTLQSELKELKEQLSMFESASSLGVFSTSQTRSTGLADDSMTDLGIKKVLDFSTPGSQGKYDGNRSSNETIVSLKVELERCLTSNRQKRSQVSKLHEEVKVIKKEVKVLKEENSRLEKLTEEQKIKLRDFEDLVQPGNKLSAVEMRLKKDIENLTREKSALSEDNEELQKRLDELGASEERLTEINQELTSQISQMVRDYDSDKRDALDRLQRTCDSVHEETRDMLRQELETKFSVERAHLVTKYETEVAKIRTELQSTLHELDEVKELYVRAGEERTELEDKLRTQLEDFQQKDLQLKQMREEQEEERGRRDQTREESRDAVRDQIQKELETDQETAFTHRLQEELAKARDDWLASQDTQTLRSEVKASVEKELTLKHEAEVEELVLAKIEQAKINWMSERKILLESEVQQRLQTERVTWQETANQRLEEAVNTAIDHARQQWLKSEDQEKPNFEELLESAKLSWERESEEKLEEAVKAAAEKAREEIEKEFKESEQERLKIEKTKWQVEADALHEVDIKQAVEEARKLFEKENMNDSADCGYQHRLQTEKQKWQLEADRKLQLEVSRVAERAQKGLGLSDSERRNLIEAEVTRRVEAERSHWVEKQAADMMLEIERSLKTAEEEWRKEAEEEKKKMKEVLEVELGVKLKDEMAKAVDEAKLQWEKDHITQHAALSASQSAAEVERSILQQEVENLKQERNRLLAELKQKESDWLQERQAVIGQKDEERRRLVRETEEQCEKEYQKFMSEQQETLSQALQTSRQQQERLQQEKVELQEQYEEVLGRLREKETDGNLSNNLQEEDLDGSVLEQERQVWEQEAQKLKKSILNRDSLLKQADQHMSQEVEKLRAELEEAYQTQLEAEVQKLQRRYESEFNESLSGSGHEMNKIHEEIEKMTENFGKEKVQYLHKIEHLESELLEKKDSLLHLEQKIKEKYTNEIDRLLKEGNVLKQKLDKLQGELDVKVKENETLRNSVKNMESAYRRDMKSQKEKFDEINHRLQKSEKSLSEVKKRNSLEVEDLKKAVNESEAAMSNLTQKMMEKQKANAMMIEAMKKQHKTEKRELLKQLKKHSSDRGMTSTPVQTEATGDIMLDLRSQYLETVDKIREDVMHHITQTNLRAADTVRTGITREKQITVTQLKRFYKSSIRKILQGELIGADLEGKLASIDQALEALSVSISSSRSNTPDNEVKVNVSQGQGQSSNSSLSSVGSIGSYMTQGSDSSDISTASSTQNFQSRRQTSDNKTSQREQAVPKLNSEVKNRKISSNQSSKMMSKKGKEAFPRPSQNLSLFDKNGSRILETPSPVNSDSDNQNNNVNIVTSRSFRPINQETITSRLQSDQRRNQSTHSTLDEDGFVRPKNPSMKSNKSKHEAESSESKPTRNSSLPPTSSRPRPQLSLLRRSMEDEYSTPKQLEPFSYQGMSKSQSELALNTLADFDVARDKPGVSGASPGVQISYKYTPLRSSLQGGSPSTSLFSNHSLSEGDLRYTENDDEPVLTLQSLGLGKASPRKFNPVPEKLDMESGYHTPKKSPSDLFGRKMAYSLDNLSVLGLSLEEQSLEEEFAPLVRNSNGAFREFQKVGHFPSSKGKNVIDSVGSHHRGHRGESSSVTKQRTNGSHSYKESHKGRQPKPRETESEKVRSPNVTVRASFPSSLQK